MCLYLFSPGRKLQIDYAAESITLVDGGKESIFDILVTNHSDTGVAERIHVIYPAPVPMTGATGPRSPMLEDLTETWLDVESPYNRFYEHDNLKRSEAVGSTTVSVDIPNPRDTSQVFPYVGRIKGMQHLSSYSAEADERLTDKQWQILTDLGWSVFTLRFEDPLQKNDARWLRLQGQTGCLQENDFSWIESWTKKLLRLLVHHFELAGPKDMKHRLVKALVGAGVKSKATSAFRTSMMELHTLQDKLIKQGMDAQDTETAIIDWRLNIFWRYRELLDPTASGDVRPSGGLLNTVFGPGGWKETCYQWKAGEQNVPQMNGGRFAIHLRANDVPLIVPLVPWIALLVGLSNSWIIRGLIEWILRVFKS